jgi:hypothetical protein
VKNAICWLVLLVFFCVSELQDTISCFQVVVFLLCLVSLQDYSNVAYGWFCMYLTLVLQNTCAAMGIFKGLIPSQVIVYCLFSILDLLWSLVCCIEFSPMIHEPLNIVVIGY